MSMMLIRFTSQNIGTDAQRRGWLIDTVQSIGINNIVLTGQGLLNIGFGTGTATTAEVKVVHDNTYALSNAIDNYSCRRW